MSFLQLKKKISEIILLNQEDHELIETFFIPRKVEKNVSLIEAGNHTQEVFFVNSGYLRYYNITDSGDELIIHLYSPNNFATSLKSFFSGSPSEEIMRTITDCKLLFISKNDLEKLYSTSQKWQYFGRKLMESFLIEKEQRIIDQLSLTGQQRYVNLLETNPYLFIGIRFI